MYAEAGLTAADIVRTVRQTLGFKGAVPKAGLRLV
jgi:hypothetical protein